MDTGWERPRNPFHRTMEDLDGALAQYYDFPTLSLRNAIWILDAQKKPDGFGMRDMCVRC